MVMPRMGETVDDGTINSWYFKPGDRVEAGQPLLEIGTDKVDSEVPAPVSGVLREIRVQAGETVDIGTVLGVIDPD
ncbi:2-oxoglutarate dehydrogenase E2 component (dihydrolipoamide succinyltransferase) [Sinosporangium album]|uniref:2-oxoglutarate dehydrogenase E2 component (Dihydrolipoamide succinyltransferase) n=1 Tax=Sinosporangium album TaxID=504805 RepID=A0A1G8JHE1_9ACTN|nr:2-oxoglutarate dehydrogenase E2 component (dihydrolipoamide succinyltransferase) [Sinosporangium album]